MPQFVSREMENDCIQMIPAQQASPNTAMPDSITKSLSLYNDPTITLESEDTDCPISPPRRRTPSWTISILSTSAIRQLRKYITFIGPGFIIAVSYIDPGNYSTDVAAGALFEYKMLFILFLTNLFAIFLQGLSCKLGCVTGLTLPQLCRLHLPRWTHIPLYIVFEIAILATDLAEVIGTAIALNMLLRIPLVWGVLLTMFDVLIVLFAWKTDGGMRAIRVFELGVATLVLMVVGCFISLLCKIDGISAPAVLRGYLPNMVVFSGSGIYTSLSIMGAVVMPHSLILGTSLSLPRLKSWDTSHGFLVKSCTENEHTNQPSYKPSYKPTIGAINSILTMSLVEIAVSLLTFALFVNSAILIVAGSALYGVDGAADADLFGIHDLLSSVVNPAAGTIFAVALLASGQSAGIVATMAGQLVSEGFFDWTLRPWLRRLITRSIAILPCILVAGLVGRSGLAQVLNASQVVLSLLLPVITFPLIKFTANPEIMKVAANSRPAGNQACVHTATGSTPMQDEQGIMTQAEPESVNMANKKIIHFLGIAIWLTITGLNIYLIVILAKTHGTGQ